MSSSKTRASWLENCLQLKDTVVPKPVPLKLKNKDGICQCEFISKDEIAVRYEMNNISIYSLQGKEIIDRMETAADVYLHEVFPLRRSILLIWNDQNISIWDRFTQTCDMLFGIKGEKDSSFSETWVTVPRDGDREHLITVTREKVSLLRLLQEGNGHWTCSIEKVLTFPKANPEEPEQLKSISAYGSRVAVATDSRVIVFDFSVDLVVFESSEGNYRVLLSDQFLIMHSCVSSRVKISIRDGQSFQIMSEYKQHDDITYQLEKNSKSCQFRSFNCSLEGPLLILRLHFRSRKDKRKKKTPDAFQYHQVHLATSVRTGEVLFKQTSPDCFRSCDIIIQPKLHPNGLLSNDENNQFLIPIPQAVLRVAFGGEKVVAIGTLPDKTLQIIYYSMITSADRSPKDIAVHYISSDVCRESLCAFYYAHRILMLAIQDNSVESNIDRSPNFGGVRNKWQHSIYSAAKDLKISDKKECVVLNDIAREATNFNVINTSTADCITRQLSNGKPNIFQLEVQLASRLMVLEPSLESLRHALTRYIQIQGIIQTVNIALTLIPFLGAFSVPMGEDTTIVKLCNEFSLIDAVHSTFGDDDDGFISTDTFELRLIKFVAGKLSPKELSKMELHNRKFLSTCLELCELTEEVLYSVLIGAASGQYRRPQFYMLEPSVGLATQLDIDQQDNQAPDVVDSEKKTQRSSNIDVIALSEIDIIASSFENTERGSGENELFSTVFDRTNIPPHNATEGPTQMPTAETDMSKWNIKDVKEFGLEVDKIRDLDNTDASVVLAAFLCRYSLKDAQKYLRLKMVLLHSFNSMDIDGLVLAERKFFPALVLSEDIFKYMDDHSPKGAESKYIEGKIQYFLSILSS